MSHVRLIIVGFAVICIFGCGIFIGTFFHQTPEPQPQIQNTTTILKQVQALSELVTVKYVMERVVILSDVKWYGENKVVILAPGIVKAGIDLRDIKPDDIKFAEKKITITIGKAKIVDVYLDDRNLQVMERSTGLFRTFDKDIEQTARRQAVADLGSAARQSGILKEAETQGHAQLKNLFKQLGFAGVEILSRP